MRRRLLSTADTSAPQRPHRRVQESAEAEDGAGRSARRRRVLDQAVIPGLRRPSAIHVIVNATAPGRWPRGLMPFPGVSNREVTRNSANPSIAKALAWNRIAIFAQRVVPSQASSPANTANAHAGLAGALRPGRAPASTTEPVPGALQRRLSAPDTLPFPGGFTSANRPQPPAAVARSP